MGVAGSSMVAPGVGLGGLGTFKFTSSARNDKHSDKDKTSR